MPLSPADVNGKEFKITRKGYNVDEVDAFLDEVQAELVRLLSDNSTLRAKPGQAAPAPAAPPGETAVPATGAPIMAGETEAVALRTLLLAQQTADAAVAQARAEAEVIVSEARSASAAGKAEVAAILSDARGKSAAADVEAAAKVAAVLGDLDERRRQLERHIEDLRAFEREYRVRLKAYLEGQLRDLDGRGTADGAGSGVPAGARASAVGGTPGVAAGVGTPPAVSLAPAAASVPPAPPNIEAHPSSVSSAPAPTLGSAPAVAPDRPLPSGPPAEAVAPSTARAVPPLSKAPEPVGPFTVVPRVVEELDDGPEPPIER